MAILITLFEINIVANNILGESINWRIVLCFFNVDSFNKFLSDGDKEKKAISEPEIKPEPIKSKRHDTKGVKKL